MTGTAVATYGYTGREPDASGLTYYRARYYDPSMRRFTQRDPIGFGGGLNLYAYVDNNPVNANDPSGLDPISTIIKYGGRLGSTETRDHIGELASEWIAKGWNLRSGGAQRETLIPGPGGKAKGGAYGDIVLEHPVTGEKLIINTVDTYADGVTATAREVAAGAKIQNLRPDTTFMMIPKPKPGQMAGGAAAALGAGGAHASDGGILGIGITWGDVRTFGGDAANFAVDFLTPGGVGDAGRGSDVIPRGGAGKQTMSGVSPRM